MLKLFEVSGFKGFKEKYVMDFLGVHDYKFAEKNIKNGFIKNAIIYGKNSVGKTNLGLAILDITSHLNDNNVGPRLYDYYVNSESSEAEFKYVFKFDKDEIIYKYIKEDLKKLLSEEIYINQTCFFKYDYEANTGDFKEVEKLAPTLNYNFKNDGSILRFILNNIALVENDPLYKFMKYISNMLWFRTLDENRYVGFKNESNDYFNFILENKELLEQFEKLLNSIGVTCELKVYHMNDARKHLYIVQNGKPLPFFAVASSGTKALYTFFYWYKTAQNASFMFIDEFDAYYHHELSETIVKLLQENDNTQTILTTHNTNLLSNSISRPDCYFILTQDKIVPIVDATDRELREGHNLEKLYKAGEFDG